MKVKEIVCIIGNCSSDVKEIINEELMALFFDGSGSYPVAEGCIGIEEFPDINREAEKCLVHFNELLHMYAFNDRPAPIDHIIVLDVRLPVKYIIIDMPTARSLTYPIPETAKGLILRNSYYDKKYKELSYYFGIPRIWYHDGMHVDSLRHEINRVLTTYDAHQNLRLELIKNSSWTTVREYSRFQNEFNNLSIFDKLNYIIFDSNTNAFFKVCLISEMLARHCIDSPVVSVVFNGTFRTGISKVKWYDDLFYCEPEEYNTGGCELRRRPTTKELIRLKKRIGMWGFPCTPPEPEIEYVETTDSPEECYQLKDVPLIDKIINYYLKEVGSENFDDEAIQKLITYFNANKFKDTQYFSL